MAVRLFYESRDRLFQCFICRYFNGEGDLRREGQGQAKGGVMDAAVWVCVNAASAATKCLGFPRGYDGEARGPNQTGDDGWIFNQSISK